MIEQGGLAKAQSAALNASTDDYAPRERNCDRRGARIRVTRWLIRAKSCDTITTLEPNCAVETVPDRLRPRFRPDSVPPLPRVGFRLGLGRERGITTCLPLAASVLRASTSELAVLNLKRRSSRPRVQGNSYGCLLSRSQPHRLRHARSPRSSPKNPNFAPAGRRRWATIKRHRP